MYDKEKAEKVKEYLADHSRPLDKPRKKDSIPPKLQRFNIQGDRKTFIDDIIRVEKKKQTQYPDREDRIDEIKEKLDEYYKEKKNPIETMKDKYHKNKGSLAKCDLIGVVSDAEHVGEKIPFCPKQIPGEGDDGDSKAKGRTKSTYPPVRKLLTLLKD